MEELNGCTRVTQILAPFSGLCRISPAILENAAHRGTRVHIAVDSLINNIGCDPDDDISGYVESFKLWRKDKEFIKTPKRLFCSTHLITGEVDAVYKCQDSIYKDNGGLTIVDFKTSAKEGKTWMLQGSAYSYLAKLAGYRIKMIEFVRLKKDGKMAHSYFYDEEFQSFLQLKDVYENYFKTSLTQEEMDYEYI